MSGIKNHLMKIQIGSAIAVIIFVVTATACLINAKRDVEGRLDTMENQYDHVHKWYLALEAKQEAIDAENRKQALIVVEIRTKLANIESMLLEMKQDN